MSRGTSLQQNWSSRLYAENARFVGDLADAAIALLAPVRGERILDIGCGDGYLTERIAHSGATMVGLDFSGELVAAAVARGLDVHHGNAEAMTYVNEFDGVFSNAALHWMRNPDALIAGVVRSLRPGGRFVGEFAGANNAQIIRREVHAALDKRGYDSNEIDPWYLPTAEDYRDRLVRAGMTATHVELFDRPVIIEYPIGDWVRTFGSPYLAVLPDENERVALLSEISKSLESELYVNNGKWKVDYTRLRFRAELP